METLTDECITHRPTTRVVQNGVGIPKTQGSRPHSATTPEKEIDRILRATIKLKGSDLHLRVGSPPSVRVRGTLRYLSRGPLDDGEMERLCLPLLDERNARTFEKDGGADFAYTVSYLGTTYRFRMNLLRYAGHLGLVARLVNHQVPDFNALHLPPIIERLCKFDQGMILLAGVTGSGKSTTIASMLNWINANYHKHILTLEDPIEFVFTQDKCLITQREIGADVRDFEIAMRHAVREDPDVILVGELRDKETFATAVHAAETGHLVFATIHASNCASTVGRILDLFPADQHNSIRSALAFNLKAIIAQKLLPSMKEGVGRVPTTEIMVVNPTVRKLILDEKENRLIDAIRMSASEGMQDFTMSLKELVDRKLIAPAVALEVAPNPEALTMALKGINILQPGIL
jgi:twitching motility protein PilT